MSKPSKAKNGYLQKEIKQMSNGDDDSKLIYSYWTLRNAVGWIGVSLPFVLMLGVFLIFGGNVIEESISSYYYTGMRDVFVGALCGIALFMFYYYGYSELDNWTGNFAGFFALGVAWFPTTETGPADLIGKIHFAFAALLFLTLVFFSIFLFTKSKKGVPPTPEKLKRNKIYIICGIIILICIISIPIYKYLIEPNTPISAFVFWAETIALIAFGVSWLTKGETIFPDKENK